MRIIARTTHKLRTALAFAAVSLLYAGPALAQLSESTGLGATAGTAGLRTNTNISDIVGKFIGALITLLGIVFVVLFVYGGFVWMTAQGNEEKIKKAKNILTSAVVGLVIVFASYAIASAVIGALSTAVGEPAAPAAAP